LLGCERGGKYRCYKKDLKVIESGSRKCKCPFRVRGKPMKDSEVWVVDVVFGFHNHDLVETLVGNPYVDRLTKYEKTMLIDMTNFC